MRVGALLLAGFFAVTPWKVRVELYESDAVNLVRDDAFVRIEPIRGRDAIDEGPAIRGVFPATIDPDAYATVKLCVTFKGETTYEYKKVQATIKYVIPERIPIGQVDVSKI